MKWKLSALVILAVTCVMSRPVLAQKNSHSHVSSETAHAIHHQHLPEGGRRALHGMVLFGSGPYFLEHIPMLTPPHDFQIVTEIVLNDQFGNSIQQSFSDQGYSLKPAESFSLNDYVAGRLKKFKASIHQGSFEQGGALVPGLGEVTVEIKEYKVIRQLPSTAKEMKFKLTDGIHTFESNAIQPGQNIQQIVNVTTGEKLWCVQGPDFFESCKE